VTNGQSDWQKYERLIARFVADNAPTSLCVTPNAKVVGRISGRSRQLDALIDSRHDTDNSRRIVVDAKKRRRKVDVTHVEAFRGLVEDVGGTHGILVCPAGYTDAALRRAQNFVSIALVPLDHLNDFDPSSWPKCQGARCNGGRVFWDGYPELSVSLRPVAATDPQHTKVMPFIHYVGKCDRCGRFHVHCLTCDQLFSLDDDAGDHHCTCRMPWFWMASVERDEASEYSAELHAVLQTGSVMTVDRRPVRAPSKADR
jgi:hypothetical protein